MVRRKRLWLVLEKDQQKKQAPSLASPNETEWDRLKKQSCFYPKYSVYVTLLRLKKKNNGKRNTSNIQILKQTNKKRIFLRSKCVEVACIQAWERLSAALEAHQTAWWVLSAWNVFWNINYSRTLWNKTTPIMLEFHNTSTWDDKNVFIISLSPLTGMSRQGC